MNKRIFKTLILVGALALSAFAGGKRTTTGPTITASCHSCSATDAISFVGSGYKAGTTVMVTVQGPTSYSITTYADSTGSINVYYGTVLSYAPGLYSVSASSVSGKTVTPVAYDSFDVQ
jgi:hypothetical protein